MALKDKLMYLAGRGGATPAQVEEIANAIAQSGGAGLPAVTASDNGKFLRVVSGAWAAETVPAAEGSAF